MAVTNVAESSFNGGIEEKRTNFDKKKAFEKREYFDKNKIFERNDALAKKEGIIKPDDKVFRTKLAEEASSIVEIRGKLTELNKEIAKSSVGKEEYKRKKTEIRRRLDEFQEKEAQLDAEKNQIFHTLDDKQKQGKEQRANAYNLKKSMGFSTEGDIDKKIEEIETRMMTSTISLKEEKKLIAEIALLKSNKPILGKCQNNDNNNNEDNTIGPLREQLETLRDSISKLRVLRKDESEKLRNFMKKRNEETSSMRELYDQLDVYNKQLTVHFDQKRALQDEFNRDMEKYNTSISKLTAVRNEKMKEENKKKNDENERYFILKKLDKIGDMPLQNEVLLLQQTMQYVQKLIHQKQHNTDNNNNNNNNNNITILPRDSDTTENNGDGLTLVPKNERKEEFYYAPKEKKIGKKTAGKQKVKNFKLDIATLSIFDQIRIPPPNTYDDLDDIINKLNEKMKTYKDEQMRIYGESEQIRKELEGKLAALDAKPMPNGTKKLAADDMGNCDTSEDTTN